MEASLLRRWPVLLPIILGSVAFFLLVERFFGLRTMFAFGLGACLVVGLIVSRTARRAERHRQAARRAINAAREPIDVDIQIAAIAANTRLPAHDLKAVWLESARLLGLDPARMRPTDRLLDDYAPAIPEGEPPGFIDYDYDDLEWLLHDERTRRSLPRHHRVPTTLHEFLQAALTPFPPDPSLSSFEL